MFIDIVFVILMVIASYKGLRKGLIIALFSILGFVIGLAAALKLSAVVALKLAEHTGNAKWLPIVSFLIVFLLTAFLVNLCGKLIQKTFETILLGWANRLAGALLFIILYSLIFSVFLFYAVQLKFIKPDIITASVVYPYLQPLAPQVLAGISIIIPWFKNIFGELEQFFGKYATPSS